MVAWINVGVLVVSTILTARFYVKSVGPAALEKRIGPRAYARCSRYRMVVAVCMTVVCVNYVVYYSYPLPLPLARTFPWSWWVSAVIAGVIGLPCGYLMCRGIKDAGQETMIVKREHTMYGGIYEKIRHPQALGELPLWWVIALLLHSPFLALYSLVWVPIFALMCWAEERDLVLRYGRQYEEYRKRTPALIPRLW